MSRIGASQGSTGRFHPVVPAGAASIMVRSVSQAASPSPTPPASKRCRRGFPEPVARLQFLDRPVGVCHERRGASGFLLRTAGHRLAMSDRA